MNCRISNGENEKLSGRPSLSLASPSTELHWSQIVSFLNRPVFENGGSSAWSWCW